MGYDWGILVPCMGLVAFSQSGKFTLKTQRNPSNIPFFYRIGNYQKFPVWVVPIFPSLMKSATDRLRGPNLLGFDKAPLPLATFGG